MTMFGGGRIYEKLGVRPVVNALSNATVLGGSTPPPAVLEAMEEANLHWVEMRELLEKSGEFIAGVLGTEAAYVTSGCMAALTLSTAACMAGTDPEKIGQLPDTSGMKNEILFQRSQRYNFDRCYTLPGGKLVEVGDDDRCTPAQLEEAIGPNTAAVGYYIQPDWDNTVLSLAEVVEIAHRKNVPVIADAASQIYPLEYMRDSAQGADLVCFGAKYFGSGHSTGMVAGKKDMVDAVVAQGFIAYHHDGGKAFGRPMKLERQEIVGVVAALDRWFSMNHEDRFQEYDRSFSAIQQCLRGVTNAQLKVVPNEKFFGSSLNVEVDRASVGKTAQQVADELAEGSPRVWVGVQGDDTVVVNVHNLNEGDEDIIVDRLKDVLGG